MTSWCGKTTRPYCQKRRFHRLDLGRSDRRHHGIIGTDGATYILDVELLQLRQVVIIMVFIWEYMTRYVHGISADRDAQSPLLMVSPSNVAAFVRVGTHHQSWQLGLPTCIPFGSLSGTQT